MPLQPLSPVSLMGGHPIKRTHDYYPLTDVMVDDDELEKIALRFTEGRTTEPVYTLVKLALINLREAAASGRSTIPSIKLLRDLASGCNGDTSGALPSSSSPVPQEDLAGWTSNDS